MNGMWARAGAIVALVLVGGLPVAAQSPSPTIPASASAEVTGTATCTLTVEGDRTGETQPFLLTGGVLTCAETTTDPRVNGTSTVVRSVQTWSETSPGAGVGWGDYTLVGPEGTWTGRHYDIDGSTGVSSTTTIAVGRGAYTGWTYARAATVAADGSVDISGVIYPDAPPPGFPVTLSTANPDEDLGPVPAVTEVTPALVGTLQLGKGKGKPATATIGAAGGSIAITKRTDPLAGLVLTVPPGAFATDTSFTISSQPIKGHDFGPLISPATPLITVENGGAYADDLVTVRIPVRIPEGSFAMAFYDDATSGHLEGMPLVAEDATGLTIATRHFSSFFVSLIELAALPPIVDSGFRPGVDDWQFTNFGSYLEPDGHCSGQSVSAMWYYSERHLKAGASHLWGLYDNNGAPSKTPSLWQDDSDGYRLASMVQHDSDFRSWAAKLFTHSEAMPDWLHRAAIRYSMAVTGEPQELLIYDATGGSGHAIVAYRVTRDFILVADPNYPGDHRAIRWDETAQDLRPYSSGSNAADIAENGVTSYTQILYAAKSALVQWPKIAQRWSEFAAGTIGDGVFPGYTLEASTEKDEDGNDVWVPLTDGLTTDKVKIKVQISELTDGTDGNISVVLGDAQTVPRRTFIEQEVDLVPGENQLGIQVGGVVSGTWNYVDFVRLTVNSGPTPSPTPSPTRGLDEPVRITINAVVPIGGLNNDTATCPAEVTLAFTPSGGDPTGTGATRLASGAGLWADCTEFAVRAIDASGTFDGSSFDLKEGRWSWTGTFDGSTATITGGPGPQGVTLVFPVGP